MNAPAQPIAELWTVALVIVFPILWCVVLAGISFLGEWQALANTLSAKGATGRYNQKLWMGVEKGGVLGFEFG